LGGCLSRRLVRPLPEGRGREHLPSVEFDPERVCEDRASPAWKIIMEAHYGSSDS
jgi:hypothetical protein